MDRLVLIYAWLTACFFVIQGVWILRTHSVGGLFARFGNRSRAAGGQVSLTMLWFCAMLYIVSGVGVFTLLVITLIKRGLVAHLDLQHLADASPHLIGPGSGVALGIWALVRPSGLLRWARRAYPEIAENDPRLLPYVRFIGAGMLAIGLVMFFAFAQ
jgi:hypothetical protein